MSDGIKPGDVLEVRRIPGTISAQALDAYLDGTPAEYFAKEVEVYEDHLKRGAMAWLISSPGFHDIHKRSISINTATRNFYAGMRDAMGEG